MSETREERGLLCGYEVIGKYYDAIPLYANRTDIDSYVGCAQEADGPILELGCGKSPEIIFVAAKAG